MKNILMLLLSLQIFLLDYIELNSSSICSMGDTDIFSVKNVHKSTSRLRFRKKINLFEKLLKKVFDIFYYQFSARTLVMAL